jgi:hypothetical protein
MAHHIKKEGSNVKGNNMSKSIRHHIYGLYLKIMVLKHAEQTEQLWSNKKIHCLRKQTSGIEKVWM